MQDASGKHLWRNGGGVSEENQITVGLLFVFGGRRFLGGGGRVGWRQIGRLQPAAVLERAAEDEFYLRVETAQFIGGPAL